MKFLKALAGVLVAGAVATGSAWAADSKASSDAAGSLASKPLSPLGYWRVIDRSSGQVESIVRVRKENGKYVVRVVGIYTDNPRVPLICTKCTGIQKNKPLINMPVVWNAVDDPRRLGYFIDGYAMDPKNGKTYKGSGHISEDGRKLYMRGFIDLNVLGRTEVWLRSSESELRETPLNIYNAKEKF